MRKLIIIIILCIVFKTGVTQRIKQLGQPNLHYYLPFLRGDTVAVGTNAPTAKFHVSGSTKIDLGSDANYDVYYRNSSGLFTRLAAGADGYIFTTHSTTSAPTWEAPGGLSGSGTSGRVAYWNGASSLTSDANFLFNGSVFSVGTTNTQGQLNIGGNKNINSSGAQSYFAAATYTDNVTAASGTASSMSFNLIAAPTLAATNSSVTTPEAYTLYIDKPIAGTNQTINRRFSLLANGPVKIAESITRAYTGAATDITLDQTHDIVGASAAGGNRSITLPSAANNAGLTYTIKRTDASGNTCTVIGTIDGATNYSLTAQYKYVTVTSNGTDWYIIANN